MINVALITGKTEVAVLSVKTVAITAFCCSKISSTNDNNSNCDCCFCGGTDKWYCWKIIMVDDNDNSIWWKRIHTPPTAVNNRLSMSSSGVNRFVQAALRILQSGQEDERNSPVDLINLTFHLLHFNLQIDERMYHLVFFQNSHSSNYQM